MLCYAMQGPPQHGGGAPPGWGAGSQQQQQQQQQQQWGGPPPHAPPDGSWGPASEAWPAPQGPPGGFGHEGGRSPDPEPPSCTSSSSSSPSPSSCGCGGGGCCRCCSREHASPASQAGHTAPMLNIILHTPPLAGLPDQLVLAVPHGSQVCLDEDGAISRRCHIEEGAHVRKVRK